MENQEIDQVAAYQKKLTRYADLTALLKFTPDQWVLTKHTICRELSEAKPSFQKDLFIAWEIDNTLAVSFKEGSENGGYFTQDALYFTLLTSGKVSIACYLQDETIYDTLQEHHKPLRKLSLLGGPFHLNDINRDLILTYVNEFLDRLIEKYG